MLVLRPDVTRGTDRPHALAGLAALSPLSRASHPGAPGAYRSYTPGPALTTRGAGALLPSIHDASAITAILAADHSGKWSIPATGPPVETPERARATGGAGTATWPRTAPYSYLVPDSPSPFASPTHRTELYLRRPRQTLMVACTSR